LPSREKSDTERKEFNTEITEGTEFTEKKDKAEAQEKKGKGNQVPGNTAKLSPTHPRGKRTLVMPKPVARLGSARLLRGW
jgi:hypothetical protein